MSQGPGTKVIARHDMGTRTVGGVIVRIEETIWNGFENSPLYDVYLATDEDEECISEESFDELPTDQDIDWLLKTRRHPFHMSPVIGCSSCEAISPGEWRERHAERGE